MDNMHKYKKGIIVALYMAINMCSAGDFNAVVGCVDDAAYAPYCEIGRPRGIAINPAGTRAYVCNSGSSGLSGTGSVSVIDLATNAVIGCIDDSAYSGTCNFRTPRAIAINPSGTRAYVCNSSGNSVSVIDLITNEVIECIDDSAYSGYCGFNQIRAIAIEPTGAKAYVCNSGSGTPGTESVSVIDLATNAVIACVDDTLCPFNRPAAIAIAGTKAYVCNAGTAPVFGTTVSVIDLATNAVIACVDDTLCPFNRPLAIAINPAGTRAYVCNPTSVSVINLTTDAVIGCIDDSAYLGSCSFLDAVAIAINPAGTRAYVCNQSGGASSQGSINVIDLTTNAVIGCIDDSAYGSCEFNAPVALAIAPDGAKGYVSNFNNNSVSVLGFRAPTPPTPPSGSVLPPASISGCRSRNVFLLQTDYINALTWTAPQSGSVPVSYKIYRDAGLTDLIATIPASGALEYADHGRNPNVIYSYFIVSVDSDGNPSQAKSVTVTESC